LDAHSGVTPKYYDFGWCGLYLGKVCYFNADDFNKKQKVCCRWRENRYYGWQIKDDWQTKRIGHGAPQPTNHMDMEAIEALNNALKSSLMVLPD